MKKSGFDNAVILLDKPEGKTSFELISEVKRITGIKKIGHCGTLDRFASGLMLLCTGQATKLARYFLESDKRYSGRIRLGIETDTCDITGNVTSDRPFSSVDWGRAVNILSGFKGTFSQVPPRYSALKIDGRRASDRIRAGEDINLQPRDVTVYAVSVTGYDRVEGTIDFDLSCSKGTYVRSIARDLGAELGTGACLACLRRTGSGFFDVSQAVRVDTLRDYAKAPDYEDGRFILDPRDALSGFGEMVLDNHGRSRVMNGAMFTRENVILMEKGEKNFFLLADELKNLIAIAEIDIDKWLIKYNSVFNQN